MKKAGTGNHRARSPRAMSGRIHPVIIYPICHPDSLIDLEILYEFIAGLDADKVRYSRPITVMDHKTNHAARANKKFQAFKEKTVARHSDLLEAWCVDTCQMWYTGLGEAYQRGKSGDVYWLIPGDFNYASGPGKEVMGHLHDLPEIIEELDQDICIGEIETEHDNPKHLIDTYGTFALMYNWFPEAAREIRLFTERPRSEFFAIRHEFLGEMLEHRWYAYEQTMVMLLQAVMNKRRISRYSVGHITDMPDGYESLSSAIQQVERTERVLKSHWRDLHTTQPGWLNGYRDLELQSEQVCRTAWRILQGMLK
jgi:hypothetical protein